MAFLLRIKINPDFGNSLRKRFQEDLLAKAKAYEGTFLIAAGLMIPVPRRLKKPDTVEATLDVQENIHALTHSGNPHIHLEFPIGTPSSPIRINRTYPIGRYYGLR